MTASGSTGPGRLPDALPDGSKLLHIGLPKTGTTALQHSLWEARSALEAEGARNVSSRAHERKVALTAAGTDRDYWGSQSDRYAELAADFRTSTSRVTFWSSESLSAARPDRISGLRDELGPAHVVVTIRALAPQLASRWQQGLRRGGTASLEDWLHERFDSEPIGSDPRAPLTTGQALRRIDPRRVIEQWGRVFGEESLTFVVLDPNDHRWLLRAFEALLGVGEHLDLTVSGNMSLAFPEAEMLRHAAAAYLAHGGDRGEWMATAGDTRAIRLRTVVQAAPRQPIRVPRWAAERANDYVADWLAAIGGSGARLVGDPADLVVDPAAYPETLEVPQVLDVASAGRMLDAYFRVGLKLPTGPAEPDGPSPESLRAAGSREILAELRARARRRLRGR